MDRSGEPETVAEGEAGKELVATATATEAVAEHVEEQVEDRIATWRKLVIVALGLQAGPRRFVSLAVPAVFAEELAQAFRRRGFGTRISAVGRSPATRTFSLWPLQGPTPAERMREQWGKALHRDGLVIEEGYRLALEMSDEDVRRGAWFG